MFTEANPDKGTKTIFKIKDENVGIIFISLQKLTPIRGRKQHRVECIHQTFHKFTEANPDKGTKTLSR